MHAKIRTRVATLAATLVAVAGLGACGGGLAHTVSDDDVKGLTGQYASTVEAARQEVREAERKKQHGSQQFDLREKEVARAGVNVAEAEKSLDNAEDTLDKANDDLAEKLSASRERRDEAIKRAEDQYKQEAEQLQTAHDQRTKQIRDVIANAKVTAAVAEAREGYEQALLEERDAADAVARSEVWVAKARLELVKYEQLTLANELSGPSVTERKLAFETQLAEREADLREKKRELLEYEKESEAKRQALQKLQQKQQGGAAPGGGSGGGE